MSLIEEALRDRLINNVAVSALIGTRAYPIKLPQDVVLPAISYFRVSGPRIHSHQGSSGLGHPRFQVSAWSTTYTQAKDLAEKIRLTLQGFRGTVLAVRIDGIFLISDNDFYESDTEVYQVASDFEVWHAEAIPA